LVVVLAASLVPAVMVPGVASAAGPSVVPEKVKPVPATQQAWVAPSPDEASRKAMTRDQEARKINPGSGTPTATSLAPSATWGVSGQTGDFTWSYPMRVPPAAGGLMPDLGLSYRSSAVDGRTSVTNNQPSWIGDGWDLWPGYIERTYGGCIEDDVPNKGDLCWRSDNATATYAGGGGLLICCDGTGKWRAKGDDGARIERLSGAGNGDQGTGAGDTGEHWKITTVDGTQYWFGSQPDAQSTWTVPVFGDDVGEPCNRGGFDVSSCNQAWRWNLDKVVDRNGNMVRYFYAAEWNKYGLNMKDNPAADYVRGGTLHHIDYGLHETAGIAASGRVDFTTADRCVPGSVCTHDKKDNWPDTALEHKCDAAPCTTHGPTFWSTKRLSRVTTNVRSGSAFVPVDKWDLEQLYPDPGSGEKPALWLKSVKHTGLVGGSRELPPVTFEGTQMPNRVYTSGDGYSMLNRFRITGVISESGGVVSVNYAPAECSSTHKPADEVNNTMRCFPATWAPPGHEERTDYFHKYVVGKMIQSDSISSSTQQVTSYEYLDGAAWHWDTSEFAKDEKKTWNDFRGFGRIRVRTGVPAEHDPGGNPMTMTEQRFYRGMNGDRIDKSDKTKLRPPVHVSDSTGEGDAARLDHEWLQGLGFESTVFEEEVASTQPNPPVVSRTVTRPRWDGPTATRDVFKAYIVGTESERTFTALASGGWRETKTVTTYDDRGLPKTISDLGDVAVTTDDQCTTNTYARNVNRWLLALATQVNTVSTACGGTPRFPDNAIAAGRFSYDDRGNLAKSEGVKAWTTKDSPEFLVTGSASYDIHGRITESVDTSGNPVRIKFTPGTGGPVTATETTSASMPTLPAGLTAKTTLDPTSGQPLTIVDANDRLTEYVYDPLGRTSKVWLPNRPKDAEHPQGSVEYTYEIRRDAPTVVTTTKIGPNGVPISSNALFDGLLRPRQTQTPGVGMKEEPGQRPVPVEQGRLIVDTRYDSHGRAYKSTQPYFNSSKPDNNLWVASDTEVPGLTKTRFDGAGRTIETIYQAGAVTNMWSTKISYGGDRVHTTPPTGATATTVISDARGQTTELRQYHGTKPEGSYDVTKYNYTKSGQLSEVVSPQLARWNYRYDLRGRKISSQDPDAGLTELTYDDADRLTSTRDARGSTGAIAIAYDKLGRKTTTHKGDLNGPKLTETTYDTAPYGKGLPATTTRYVGERAYTTKVDSYTALNLPLSTTLTIPAEEGLLAGSYTTAFGYGEDGTLKNERYPAIGDPKAGGLEEETVGYELDNWGRPSHTVTATGVPLVANTFYTRYGEMERVEHGVLGKRAWQTFLYETSTRRPSRSIVDGEVPRPMQADVRYTYDQAGNVTSIADLTLDQTSDIQCQKYDHLRRLTEAWTPPKAQWDPDRGGCTEPPNDKTLSGPAPYWHSYTYSADGNRLEETQRTAATSSKRTYTYPTAAQPHTLASITSPAGTETYNYDLAGYTKRKVKLGTEETFNWDAEGHLESVRNTATNETTSFLYSAEGSRLLRRDSSGTTLYLGTQEAHLPAAGGKPVVTRYYKHGGKVVAMRQGSNPLTWLAGDHQGTAQITINSESQSVQRRRQFPFGAPRGVGALWVDDRGFVGGTKDSSTGLTHLGAREYDPSNGRFISVDPLMNLDDPQQMHGYAYANNSPVTFNDASGLACSGPDGIGCRHKVSKQGFGDQRDPVNKQNYENHRKQWQNNHDRRNSKCGGRGSCGAKTSYVNNRGGGFVESYDANENVYYLNDLPLPSFAPPASELISRAKDNYGGAITGAPGTEANLENTFASLISYCRDNLSYCGHDFFAWLSSEWVEFLGENGYLEGGGRSGGMGGLRSRLGLSPKRGGGGKPCSFDADTQVVMADGTTKPISEIKVGDRVLAADPETGERGARTVTAVMAHQDTVLELVTENGGQVTTTENHRFWNATDKQWQEAKDLDSGDQLLTSTGASMRVVGLLSGSESVTQAYNLTVDDLHTYHVLVGDTAALVHNDCVVHAQTDRFSTRVYAKDDVRASARLYEDEAGVLVVDVLRTQYRGKTLYAMDIDTGEVLPVQASQLLYAGFASRGVRSGQRISFPDSNAVDAGKQALDRLGHGYSQAGNDPWVLVIN
jgi:RHS repeat-associated protein